MGISSLNFSFLSVFVLLGLKAEILKGSARDFVQKPYDPDEIIKRIRDVIHRNKS